MSELPVGRIEKLSDGGPAFPPQDRVLITPAVNREQMDMLKDALAHAQQTGMTLRDYFAAAALQGLCAHITPDRNDGPVWNPVGVALRSYDLADAMLAARDGGKAGE